MTVDRETSVSYLDRLLSDDPVLSAVVGLFPEPPDAARSIWRRPEQPPLRPARVRAPVFRRIQRRLCRPEVTGIAAMVTLVTCVALGIVARSVVLALLGVAAALCLGVVCHLEIRNRRRPPGTRRG